MDRGYILDEIRRCAAENGGLPLGRERFVAKTGITESVWRGKYWLTWNEVLEQAGFAPHRMNQPHPKDHLLRHLALVVRDVGRYPTAAEIRMRRVQDGDFPSANTFRRFGTKQATIARLALYCSEQGDLHDVAQICASLVAPAGDIDEEVVRPVRDEFVYLMKSGQYYKIGRSNDVGRRSYEVGLLLPQPLTEVHHIATDDSEGIERYWHQRFADKRVRGEWFLLKPKDVAAFKRRRHFM